MNLAVDFHPEVRDEINHAHDWYDQRRSGLGGEFLDEMKHVLDIIATNPARFGFAISDVREGLLNRFPYAVYYRVLSDRIRVLAVYHTARDPTGWQSRS